jgi:hypothetical protein
VDDLDFDFDAAGISDADSLLISSTARPGHHQLLPQFLTAPGPAIPIPRQPGKHRRRRLELAQVLATTSCRLEAEVRHRGLDRSRDYSFRVFETRTAVEGRPAFRCSTPDQRANGLVSGPETSDSRSRSGPAIFTNWYRFGFRALAEAAMTLDAWHRIVGQVE